MGQSKLYLSLEYLYKGDSDVVREIGLVINGERFSSIRGTGYISSYTYVVSASIEDIPIISKHIQELAKGLSDSAIKVLIKKLKD